MELALSKFKAWLLTEDAQSLFRRGMVHPWTTQHCPIAYYLKTDENEPFVGMQYYVLNLNENQRPLPLWAKKFIHRMSHSSLEVTTLYNRCLQAIKELEDANADS